MSAALRGPSGELVPPGQFEKAESGQPKSPVLLTTLFSEVVVQN
ncbi:MAG: hypothetical protein R2857_05745 [Vampirovibrionales bacterium]